MKLIFDHDIEKTDYLELVISPNEAKLLPDQGIMCEFPKGMEGLQRDLNVFIRLDTKQRELCH